MQTTDEFTGRTLQQRLDALNSANEVRFRRAEDKKRMRRGELDPAAVLRQPPDHWLTAKVFDLLMQVPKVGRVKANRVLVMERVSPSKTIGGLSPRQRFVLARHIDHYAARRSSLRAAMEMERAA